MEFARNVLGFRDADHEETSPGAGRLVITALSCSLVGQRHRVTVLPGTLAAGLYGAAAADESFYCNYGVNPDWVGRLEEGGLRVSGVGDGGEVRMVELPAHPFYVVTLFLPQARSSAAAPHPLLVGYAAAVRASSEARRRAASGARR
ncbi:MAG TPA: hypothetical protein VIW03_04615 [Anaeromyxobacter sp.]